ncbi:hydroxymethylglutaryl-CoA synthase family protein [Streptomyces sp. NPDC057580]|uniref:hydroxymethylglutaryl-CoA synthase family protein n=1 Tax=Streptomyces sp. NPDC057580 TaxID=3346173 RepID=UPI0036C53B80
MIGIEALNVYCGPARIPVPVLFEGRGLDPKRLGNLLMDERAVNLPIEDTVTNAVNAAAPLVRALDDEARSRIEILIVSTESGVDYSKSVSSYVHEQLGLSRNCRMVEVKQACYAATAALQLCAGYLASAASPGGKALVIGSDVALVDARAEYAEPATGAGAAAVLISDEPRILRLDLGAFGTYGYETLDSARPGPEFDIADSDRSLFAYLDCLTNSYRDYTSKVESVDLRKTFGQLAMHTPFAGMVRAAHRKLMRDNTAAAQPEIAEDFERRVIPSLVYPRQVGNLCSASVYLALCSLIDCAVDTADMRVGLFSYGSGCASEFFSGVLAPGAAAELAALHIGERLCERVELSFGEYEALLAENSRCLTPVAHRTTDLDRYGPLARRAMGDRNMLVLTGVEDYHRTYAWLPDD